MTQITDTSTLALLACEEGFDPIEDRLRANIRGTIEAVFDEELNGFLGRLRYGRTVGAVKGYRHGNRDRQIIESTAKCGAIRRPLRFRTMVLVRDAIARTWCAGCHRGPEFGFAA